MSANNDLKIKNLLNNKRKLSLSKSSKNETSGTKSIEESNKKKNKKSNSNSEISIKTKKSLKKLNNCNKLNNTLNNLKNRKININTDTLNKNNEELKNIIANNNQIKSICKLATTTTTTAAEDKLIEQSLLQPPLLKSKCSICSLDLNNYIRVIGSKTLNDYCFDCLINLKIQNENYHVIDNLDFSLFNTEWTVKEELCLIGSIERFGLDNWGEISNNLKSKPKVPCEAHYYTYYCKSLDNSLPSDSDIIIKKQKILNNLNSINTNNQQHFIVDKLDIIDNNKNEENKIKEEELRKKLSKNQGIIPDQFNNSKSNNQNNNRSRHLVKNRNRKDQKNVSTVEEIIGYWSKRQEFDVEFLNEAEIEIAELEFSEDDSPEDMELKLNVIKIYNMHLDEREARKKFVIERGLLDIKRQINFERKLSKDDREIYNCLKPYARFFSVSEFDELFESLVLEKNLRQRLNILKTYKSLNLNTYEDVERYLEGDNNKKNKEEKKNSIFCENASIGLKLNKELNTVVEQLKQEEKEFIKKRNIPINLYAEIKNKLINTKGSKNSIKSSILQTFNCSKDDIDAVNDYISKLKSNK